MKPVAPVTSVLAHAAEDDRTAPVSSPSAPTAIVCDTTAYLPDEIVGRARIQRVSLYVTLDGETAAASARSPTTTPSSSACGAPTRARRPPSPPSATSSSVYEPLLAAGREIVSIHLSAGISGTCESANQARQRLIDEGRAASGSTSSTAARPAAAWACSCSRPRRWRRRAATARPCLARVDEIRDALKMWFAIDTLEYLRKGGRIGAAQALARLGAPDQADPDARGGDHPGRARPHPPPRLRAPGRVRARAPRGRRRRLGRPAHPRPRERPAAASSAAARSWAPTRSSSPRSAR